MTDKTIEDSLLRPVQEEGQQKTPATLEMLADLLHKNPDLLPLLQTQGRGNAISRRLQPITSALAAVACGSYSWIRFLVVFLLTALFNVVNLKPEIPKESRVVLDKIERDLGDLKRKHEKVLHDKTRMEEKIQTAAESYYRISRNDNLELEMGLVISTCVLGTCQDALKHLETEISDLQRGTKLTPTHILKQVIIIMGLVIAAVLTVGSHLRICLMIVAGILFAGKRNAQNYLNNQLLLAKCEDLRKNDLRKAEQLHKELIRDVEYKLPSLKKHLAVLDIEVSLYTSLHSHSD